MLLIFFSNLEILLSAFKTYAYYILLINNYKFSSICSRFIFLSLSTLFTSTIEDKSSTISFKCSASLTRSSIYIDDLTDDICFALIFIIFDSCFAIVFETSDNIPGLSKHDTLSFVDDFEAKDLSHFASILLEGSISSI